MYKPDFVQPYEGNKPYIFISFDPQDWETVSVIISDLDTRGYRIWYDDGRASGPDFIFTLAQKISKCSVFMSLISKSYIASGNCSNEFRYAFSNTKKIIPILLDDTDLPPQFELQSASTGKIRLSETGMEKGLADSFYSQCEDVLAPCLGAEKVQTKLVPGVGRLPYPAYRGKGPYVFVSYAHSDHAKVFAEIKRFNEAGYNVWYDEGIAPGSEWSDEIADALSDCSVFVVMLTPVSAPRENVLNEIDYALNEGKPFLAIYLEETELPRGLKLRVSRKQAILKYNMTEEEYTFKFTEAFTRFGLKPR